MEKNTKIIIGIVGLIAMIVIFIAGSSFLTNMRNNRKQDVTNLKVTKSSSSNKKAKSSDENSSSKNKEGQSDSSSQKESTIEIEKPKNSDYQYDANAPRNNAVFDTVESDDYYKNQVSELSRGLDFENKASDETRTQFKNYWNEIVSVIKQYKETREKYKDGANPETAQLTTDLFTNYLNNTQSGHWIVDAYSHFDLQIDDSNLKMSEVVGDAAKFEMILINKDGQQFMYINGSYNVKTNKVRNVVATYLKDGAVARDNIAKSSQSTQNTEIPL